MFPDVILRTPRLTLRPADAVLFERVELRIAPGDTASQRLAAKAGFVREGVARNAGFIHGGRVDLVIHSLVRADLDLGGAG
ncbi:GNAT family protein [Actinoplanes sp. NBRC 103695]|uniref:GNAT family N-acetyltransferase n=1 Tax=Actinoplanes sp. NBRC 103695 TaxID=3032202 RepID=UPI0024A02BD3|nr:GNAT family protein [Actinoplanes sp. NBRC 103695]GLY97984.1 hypothetical protein Acsp02_52380 [Actinoplanes sp. NBRC 103695]